MLSNILLLQMDVFNTFIELVRQTGNVTKGQIDNNELKWVPLILELPSYLKLPLWFYFFLNLFSLVLDSFMLTLQLEEWEA